MTEPIQEPTPPTRPKANLFVHYVATAYENAGDHDAGGKVTGDFSVILLGAQADGSRYLAEMDFDGTVTAATNISAPEAAAVLELLAERNLMPNCTNAYAVYNGDVTGPLRDIVVDRVNQWF